MPGKKIYRSTRPHGEITRGKTAPNRLRRVDNFILMYAGDLIKKKHQNIQNTFVDLGYGYYPITTIESAKRLRKLNSNLNVVGVEIDKERVESAEKYKNKNIDFRYGGFNLPLKSKDKIPEKAGVIRAFNVLRQYKKDQVDAAYELLFDHLILNGILIEGTSDPWGRIWVANLLRKQSRYLKHELVIFSTNFHTPFHPKNFQTVLPKNYIETVVAGEKMYDFFCAWKQAYNESISFQIWGQRQVFKQAASLLYQWGYKINPCKKFISRGYLLLYL